ncbi:MAG: NUDIX hydrolase [Geminicoccaceae bacterium]
MRFCSHCGAPVALRRPEGDTADRHVCTACGEIHYLNPKVVVGAVCRWQDRVLLCRRAIEPRSGLWVVPAGYLETGESTEEGARREAFEEAGARIEITGLLAVYNVVRIGQVQLFYDARLLDPDLAPGVETLELDLFPWAAIPWDRLAFPSVQWVLRRALEIKDEGGPHLPALGP